MRISFWKSWFFGMLLLGLTVYQLYGQAAPDAAGLRVAWDYSSQQQLAKTGGYPRLLVLKDGDWLAVYEDYRGNILLQRSSDKGASWLEPETVFRARKVYDQQTGDSVVIRMSNPELLELQGGGLLLACNYRPTRDGVAPFAIALRRSDDQGGNWSTPRVLYQAGKDFENGCWEPSFLQLPSGEVHLYFANESPYRTSDEQEISVLRSTDQGKHWEGPATVSFRAGRRDGMPVAALGQEGIYMVIEDNKVGEFKPYLVHSSLENNWRQAVRGDDANRWYALDSLQDDSVYMGAPYLLRLPQGQYLLSYQTNKNRHTDWEQSTMEVRIAGAGAKAFHRPTRPFFIPIRGEAKWNSLALLSANKVAALSSVKRADQPVAPWMIQGYLLSDTARLRHPQDTVHLFVGSHSANRLHVFGNRTGDTLELGVHFTAQASLEYQSAKAYCLYLSTPDDGVFRLVVDRSGAWEWWRLGKGDWMKDPGPSSEQGNDRLRIPVKGLKHVRLGLSLRYRTQAGELLEEPLAHMDPQDQQTWILLKL